jgi:STE24 endopeptidase
MGTTASLLSEAFDLSNGYNGYKQTGWEASSLPLLEGCLLFTLMMYLWETYLDIRQHSRLNKVGGVVPEELKRLIKIVDAEALAKKKSKGDAKPMEPKPAEPKPAEAKDGEAKDGEAKANEKAKIEDGKILETIEKDVPKFRLYGLDKSTFGLVKSAFDIFMELSFLLLGAYPAYWDMSTWVVESKLGRDPGQSEALISLVLLGFVVLQETIIGIPWSLYSTFVVEEKHGFNKTTLKLFITDQLTTLALTAVIGAPVTYAIIHLIKWGGQYFYVYVWAFLFVFSVVMMTVFPVYIQPLFNKYEELPEGELKDAIYAMAKRLSFPLTKLYQVDGSKRSSHSNAYLFGFGNNKPLSYSTLSLTR